MPERMLLKHSKLMICSGVGAVLFLSAYWGWSWFSSQFVVSSDDADVGFLRRRYSRSEQLNAAQTGSAVDVYVWPDDEWYLFVRDFKKSAANPIFLCHMNYTSTQGSYHANWSKDRQIIAVYDESSARFPDRATWVVGYDWKRGRVLKSNEIWSCLKAHGGVGPEADFPRRRDLTPQELKQFQPEKLRRFMSHK